MMKMPAAPVVRQPQSVIGYPGKTDFVRIYIASELNGPEYRTVLRHEQAHVWAAHNRRRPVDAVDKLWAMACEMEIARTIYDHKDIATITTPRSRLAGGVLPDSIKGLPDSAKLAEDIYQWLLDNQPPQELMTISGCKCEHHESDGKVEESIDAHTIVAAVRIQMDADEAAETAQAAVASSYSMIRNRPPSLIHEVDAALRVRVERERSHRRPSRRHANDGLIMPGAVSKPRPPLVEIFVDRSGSFSPEKTASAERKLRELLARYGSSIKHDVWFFGNGKLSADDYGGGGDTPYHLIPQHLAVTTPKLAIVITDDDPVAASVSPPNQDVRVICVPIGCLKTNLSRALNGVDVV